MTTSTSDLEVIAEQLTPVSHHASVRVLDGRPFVFAVGRARMHSLEIRKIDRGFKLALWEGPDGHDRLVHEREATSLDQAAGEAVQWLSKDRI